MTPERREELRRAEDALISARYNLDRKSYLATIAAQEERIKALELLLARCGDGLIECLSNYLPFDKFQACTDLVNEIDEILPATEDKKDGR